MPSFFLRTFGCRANQADSAGIREALAALSMEETGDWRRADLILVNSCTVTHRSDREVRQIVRRLHGGNPGARVVVLGCYAQRDPDGIAALPGVRLVVGNAERARLPELLQEMADSGPARVSWSPVDAAAECPLPPMGRTGGKTRPLVKIQDGCDSGCAYCIVPKVRGPGRSARPEAVLAEIIALTAAGFREIVLTGVHLGAYGRKREGHPGLAELLERIVRIPDLGRVRLSSIEPMDFDPGILRLAASGPVVAHHFHIPLQSGCDRILRLMHRPYGAARYRELVGEIVRLLPDAAVGTDVLVGFPGETEEDFAAGCALLEELPLAYLHVFPFSPREGTEAFALPGRVAPRALGRRLERVLAIGRAKSVAFRRRFVGRPLPAITLAAGPGGTRVLTGNYLSARIPDALPPNRLVTVRLEEPEPLASLINGDGPE
jgi:threonylcarbamoyladenosine tRNA methylthiotransferase MtaB